MCYARKQIWHCVQADDLGADTANSEVTCRNVEEPLEFKYWRQQSAVIEVQGVQGQSSLLRTLFHALTITIRYCCNRKKKMKDPSVDLPECVSTHSISFANMRLGPMRKPCSGFRSLQHGVSRMPLAHHASRAWHWLPVAHFVVNQ